MGRMLVNAAKDGAARAGSSHPTHRVGPDARSYRGDTADSEWEDHSSVSESATRRGSLDR